MSVAVAITSIVNGDPSAGLDRTRTKQIVEGTLTLSGNYGGASSHGDTINFAQFDQIKSGQPPTFVEIVENQGSASAGVGTAPLGFRFVYCQGTTQANGLLQITGGAAGSGQGGTEITQGGAYSGTTPSLNGAVLRFRAEFPWAV